MLTQTLLIWPPEGTVTLGWLEVRRDSYLRSSPVTYCKLGALNSKSINNTVDGAVCGEIEERITSVGIEDVHYFQSLSHLACLHHLPLQTLAFFLKVSSPLTSRTQLSHDLPSVLNNNAHLLSTYSKPGPVLNACMHYLI